jgi:hypothetical protein
MVPHILFPFRCSSVARLVECSSCETGDLKSWRPPSSRVAQFGVGAEAESASDLHGIELMSGPECERADAMGDTITRSRLPFSSARVH